MDAVKSADGTVIAYDRTGAGPALIVSLGAFCTRHTFVAPPEVRQRFTVITYDRRGRGDSGDTQPYAPEREYEDLAAVAAARARNRRLCSATPRARRSRCAPPQPVTVAQSSLFWAPEPTVVKVAEAAPAATRALPQPSTTHRDKPMASSRAKWAGEFGIDIIFGYSDISEGNQILGGQ